MSNNPMVSVPRELVEFAVGFKRNGRKNLTDQRSDQDNAQDKLRALLERPAEQHQGEPVAEVEIGFNRFNDTGEGLFVKWLLPDGAPLPQGTKLYTHADPAEVERLRAEIKHLQHTSVKEEVFDIVCKERDTLRAQLAEAHALLREVGESGFMVDGQIMPSNEAVELQDRVDSALSASAEPSAPGDGVRDERDYAIEHAGYLADAADQVLADYQAYSLAQMLENEGGDDGDGEHAEAVDSARDELHDGLANLRSMTYEFRKRRPRSKPTQL